MAIHESDSASAHVSRHRASPVDVGPSDSAVIRSIVARVVEDPAAGLLRRSFGHTLKSIGGVDRLTAGIGDVGYPGRIRNIPADARPLRIRPWVVIATAD